MQQVSTMAPAKKLQLVGNATAPLDAGIWDRINRALTGKPPASGEITTLIADARAERLKLNAHRTTLEKEALDPTRTQADASKMYDDAARMSFDGKRIDAGLERLDELLTTVSADEQRRGREGVYREVRRERDAVARERDERLGPLCDDLLRLVRRIHAVDGKIGKANDGVPASEAPIADLVKPTLRQPEHVLIIDEFDLFTRGLEAMREVFL